MGYVLFSKPPEFLNLPPFPAQQNRNVLVLHGWSVTSRNYHSVGRIGIKGHLPFQDLSRGGLGMKDLHSVVVVVGAFEKIPWFWV